jgi:hypothetical protein
MSTIRKDFLYLNRLRESGVTNMFGASPYLQDAFGFDRKEAKTALMEWMQWVNDDPNNRDK